MRKIFLVVMIAIAVALFTGDNVFAQGGDRLNPKAGFTVKGGFDIMGESEITVESESDTGDVDVGISLSAEYVIGLTDRFGIGPGITLQLPRGLDEDWPDGKFNYIPIYGLINFCIPTKGDMIPFLVFHAGYNLVFMASDMEDDFEEKAAGESIDYEGGFYWGIGGGLLFKNGIQVELLYSVNSATIEAGPYDGDVEYTKITISIGYRL